MSTGWNPEEIELAEEERSGRPSSLDRLVKSSSFGGQLGNWSAVGKGPRKILIKIGRRRGSSVYGSVFLSASGKKKFFIADGPQGSTPEEALAKAREVARGKRWNVVGVQMPRGWRGSTESSGAGATIEVAPNLSASERSKGPWIALIYGPDQNLLCKAFGKSPDDVRRLASEYATRKGLSLLSDMPGVVSKSGAETAAQIKAKVLAKLRPIEAGVSSFLSNLTSADKHAEGTQLKIAQAEARRR